MFRSTKVPIIALLVAVAFTCYLFGPARFRREKVTVQRPQVGSAAAGVFGLGGAPRQPRFGGAPGAPALNPAGEAIKRAPRALTADQRFSHALDDLREMAQRAKLARAADRPLDGELKTLRADARQAEELLPEIGASFQATAQLLHDGKHPDLFQQRNLAAEVEVTARAAELFSLVAALGQAVDQRQIPARDQALDKVVAFFAAHHQGDPQQRFDPGKLPFKPAKAMTREPATTPAAFAAALSGVTAKSAGRSLQISAPAQGDENLAATEDVQLTQPIKDLAASLGNNPVQIFNWVRNNIVWLPTYGSAQGSAVTLATRRGNAIDTSSLLIALYRAAGIPARYVYGTIEVPADRMSNWAGGVGAVGAQQLMGQGGVSSVLLANGGQIGAVRMEHVWVEAFVDFAPSRGAVNKAPDTWVAMDPSFKQYQIQSPIDLRANIPVEVDNTAAAVARPALVDAARQSVTGLDQGALDGWAEKIAEDLEFKYGSAPDVGAFTGAKTIIAEPSTVLSGSIPNKLVTRGGTWAALPDGLRHRVSMTLYGGSELDRVLGGPQLTFEVSLPAIAGRRLGVTYVPATAADEALLASFRSAPDGGDMPVYLIQVQPSIRIDDVEVLRGPSVTMGSLQGWDVGLLDPSDPNADIHSYETTAGDEMVWGIDAQGISQETIHQRFLTRPSDTAAENLFTVALYYWGQYDVLGQSAATAKGAAIQRLPSIGLFSAPLRCGYFFGVPRSGHYTSRQMDVAHSIFAVIEKDNSDRGSFQSVIGLLGSMLEGRTFDALLGRSLGSGVSAVQLLRDANEQKIPIYRITGANYDVIAPQLQVGADIQGQIGDAIAAGKTVLVSQRAPFHGNWSGLGYIIEDPATGSAAYLINGGLNGGSDDPCNPEERREPVRIPILEILIILIIILLIILLILMFPAIAAAIAAALAGLGEAAPAMAALLLALGLAASPTPASAAPGGGAPGDGIAPPGDCTPEQYAALVAAKTASCNAGPSCRTNDCATAIAALARLNDCVAAREAVMVTCFRGGDQAHIDELASANRAVANCTCTVARVCR